MLEHAGQANEGADVEEGCLETIIKKNYISMQHDNNSGGMLGAGSWCCSVPG